MAELTSDQITAKIADIDAQIAAIVAAPDGIPDYRWGEKSVSSSQIMKALMDARKMYQDLLKQIPAEGFGHTASEIDRYGVDVSDYLGD